MLVQYAILWKDWSKLVGRIGFSTFIRCFTGVMVKFEIHL